MSESKSISPETQAAIEDFFNTAAAANVLSPDERERYANYEYRVGLPDCKISTQFDRYYLMGKHYSGKKDLPDFREAIENLGAPLLAQDNPSDADLEKACRVLGRFVNGGLIRTIDGRSGSFGFHGYHPRSDKRIAQGNEPWFEMHRADEKPSRFDISRLPRV